MILQTAEPCIENIEAATAGCKQRVISLLRLRNVSLEQLHRIEAIIEEVQG